MSTDARAWLEERQVLAAAASPAPWHNHRDYGLIDGAGETLLTASTDGCESWVTDCDDAAFVEDARQSAPAAYAALTGAIDAMAQHWDFVMRNARKWGRDKPDCVCAICGAMQAIEAALGGEGQ